MSDAEGYYVVCSCPERPCGEGCESVLWWAASKDLAVAGARRWLNDHHQINARRYAKADKHRDVLGLHNRHKTTPEAARVFRDLGWGEFEGPRCSCCGLAPWDEIPDSLVCDLCDLCRECAADRHAEDECEECDARALAEAPKETP